MISWMQRHRKYLVITIWISTIAFVGAGFVGWGQYSYGSKATSVAKVGTVDISGRELQNAYNNLYSQYSQLFQGNFDEEQAKSLGLQEMALKQLVEQALVLNLSKEFGLSVSDQELMENITSQQVFFKDGRFDKETYQDLLKQNRLNKRDYEAEARKGMLINKTLALFPQRSNTIEGEALAALNTIADKVNYKTLNTEMITVNMDDTNLQTFWEGRKLNYMTAPAYEIQVVTQKQLHVDVDEATLKELYDASRSQFTDAEGKILAFDAAKDAVQTAYNDKETRRAALRQFLNFKKGTLDGNHTIETLKLEEGSQPFPSEIFEQIKALTVAEPFLKAVKVGNDYKGFKLIEILPASPKSFEAAKVQVKAEYLAEQKATQLQELAKSSVDTFSGETTDFITRNYLGSLKGLDAAQSKQFVDALFSQKTKRGYITLDNNHIVLFHVLEQKMLKTSQTDLENSAMRLKSTLLDQGLLNLLEGIYPTEIYI